MTLNMANEWDLSSPACLCLIPNKSMSMTNDAGCSGYRLLYPVYTIKLVRCLLNVCSIA